MRHKRQDFLIGVAEPLWKFIRGTACFENAAEFLSTAKMQTMKSTSTECIFDVSLVEDSLIAVESLSKFQNEAP